jgi:hypothetical protein
MLIECKKAQKIDEEKLSEISTNYANSLIKKLRLDEKIIIEPEQLIIDPKEAREVFSKFWETEESDSSTIKKLFNRRLESMLKDIEERKGFVQEGRAYIPLDDLSEKEVSLIYQIKDRDAFYKINGLIKKICWLGFLPKYANPKNHFKSFNALGSEIGHLVGDKLDCSKELGEAFDLFSKVYEVSEDIETILKTYNISKKDKIETYKERVIFDFIKNRKKERELWDTLLLDSEDAFIDKAINKKVYEDKLSALGGIDHFKKRYISTRHYDGAILFSEINNKTNDDIDKSYLLFGEILKNKSIKSTIDALDYLGMRNSDTQKYNKFLGSDIMKRKECYEKNVMKSKFHALFL